MSYELIFHPEVEDDVAVAYNWYENEKTGLGDRFLTELISCYKDLEIHPAYYGRTVKNYRRYIMRRFPFIIAFEIIRQTVYVYAVFHTGRNPNEILKRIS